MQIVPSVFVCFREFFTCIPVGRCRCIYEIQTCLIHSHRVSGSK